MKNGNIFIFIMIITKSAPRGYID